MTFSNSNLFFTVTFFYSLSSFTLASRLLVLVVLDNDIKKIQSEKGMICDLALERRIKTISQKFRGFWEKGFSDAVKDCWFYNDSINLIKNTEKGNWFCIFLMMLPKHGHMGPNFHWRLKSIKSFILKQIYFHILSTFHAEYQRRRQFNFMLYGPDRPWFSANQNNNTDFPYKNFFFYYLYFF